MNSLPKSARITSIFAFAYAGVVVLGTVFGPIVTLPFALIAIAAGIGIRRGRVWSAYGMALFLISQVVMLPFLLMRGRTSPELRNEAVFAAFLQVVGAILFFSAGRSLAKAGAARGRALQWVIVAAVSTLPLLFVEAFVVPTDSMDNTLLVGDRIFVRTFPRSAPHAEIFLR